MHIVKPNRDLIKQVLDKGARIFAVSLEDAKGKSTKIPTIAKWNNPETVYPIGSMQELDQALAMDIGTFGYAPKEAGVFVLDIDCKHGKNGLDILRSFGFDPPRQNCVTSPNDGLHYYFPEDSVPAWLKAVKRMLCDGIDVRYDRRDGWLVTPGSVGFCERAGEFRTYSGYMDDLEPMSKEWIETLYAVSIEYQKEREKTNPKPKSKTIQQSDINLFPKDMWILDDGKESVWNEWRKIKTDTTFNENFAYRYFPNGERDGKRIRMGDLSGSKGRSTSFSLVTGHIVDFNSSDSSIDVVDWLLQFRPDQFKTRIEALKHCFEIAGVVFPEKKTVTIESLPTMTEDDEFTHLCQDPTQEKITRIRGLLEDEVGIPDKEGNLHVKSNIFTLTFLASVDEDFKFLVAYNTVTGTTMYHPVYSKVDEIITSIAHRCNLYGLDMPTKAQNEFFNKIKMKNKINSTARLVRNLEQRFPEPQDVLIEFASHIIFRGEDGKPERRSEYLKANRHILRAFWGRAGLAILRAIGRTKSTLPNDILLVFHGNQGIGKSRLSKYMAMDEDLFTDLGMSPKDLRSPDCIRQYRGKWIGEFSENAVKRQNGDIVKSWTSQIYDEFVEKWEMGVTRIPRTMSCIITVNEDKFLRDLTGNRRYFLMDILHIIPELFEKPDLIAELWAYYIKHAEELIPETFIKDEESIRIINEMRDEALEYGTEGDYIDDYIHKIETQRYEEHLQHRMENPNSRPVALCKLTAMDIIDRFIEDKVRYSDFIKEKIKAKVQRLGYVLKPAKIDGKATRAFCLSFDEPGFKTRHGIE